jgi:hypothetical protein
LVFLLAGALLRSCARVFGASRQEPPARFLGAHLLTHERKPLLRDATHLGLERRKLRPERVAPDWQYFVESFTEFLSEFRMHSH